MPKPSQEPPASSKAPNQDLKDTDVLCTFKIKIESQNVEQDPSQDCFDQPSNLLKVLPGMKDHYILPSTDVGKYNVTVQLPAHVECDQCILQWTYTAGNNWGWCGDGSGALGCGHQETFRACADISVAAIGFSVFLVAFIKYAGPGRVQLIYGCK